MVAHIWSGTACTREAEGVRGRRRGCGVARTGQGMKGRGRLTRPGRSVFQKVTSYSSWSGDRVATGDARLGMADTPRVAADEIAAVTAMAARGWSDTSEDRSIWTVAPRRVTVSRATKCRGVPAPRSKALQSQTRTAKRSKRAAISASGSGTQRGGVERKAGERAYSNLRVRFLREVKTRTAPRSTSRR